MALDIRTPGGAFSTPVRARLENRSPEDIEEVIPPSTLISPRVFKGSNAKVNSRTNPSTLVMIQDKCDGFARELTFGKRLARHPRDTRACAAAQV